MAGDGKPGRVGPTDGEFLAAAARLVLAGRPLSGANLAREAGCSYPHAMKARAGLIARKLWPYRRTDRRGKGHHTREAIRAACRCLGLPEPVDPDEVVVARPDTELGRRVARYRVEWKQGHNFLTTNAWESDEDD